MYNTSLLILLTAWNELKLGRDVVLEGRTQRTCSIIHHSVCFVVRCQTLSTLKNSGRRGARPSMVVSLLWPGIQPDYKIVQLAIMA